MKNSGKNIIAAFIMICFINSVCSQTNTNLNISNPSQKPYVVYDYLSQDSLFASHFEQDSFRLDNENYFKTLLIVVNNEFAYNFIILDKDLIKLSIGGDKKIVFEGETVNKNYQNFQKELRKLKDEKVSQKTIDDFIFTYYTSNGKLLTALKYAKASITYNIYSKDSCQMLFDKLDPVLKTYEMWAETEKLLKQEVKLLQQEDLLPAYEVINTSLKNEKLVLKPKETIIIFWASWCGFCIQEIKLLKQNQEKLENFEIVLISLEKDPQDWINAIEKHQISNYTNYLLPKNYAHEMAQAFAVNGIPHNVLLNADGVIQKPKFDLRKEEEKSFRYFFR